MSIRCRNFILIGSIRQKLGVFLPGSIKLHPCDMDRYLDLLFYRDGNTVNATGETLALNKDPYLPTYPTLLGKPLLYARKILVNLTVKSISTSEGSGVCNILGYWFKLVLL